MFTASEPTKMGLKSRAPGSHWPPGFHKKPASKSILAIEIRMKFGWKTSPTARKKVSCWFQRPEKCSFSSASALHGRGGVQKLSVSVPVSVDDQLGHSQTCKARITLR